MVEAIQRDPVRVQRGGQTIEGFATHALYLDRRNEAGEVIGPGEMLGVGFEFTNHNGTQFNLYAQMDDVTRL